jgi:Cysteine-rich CPCC
VSDPRFPCLCCGHLTLPEPPPGSDEICEVCGWEDDPVQADDPDFRGGANSGSLDEVRASFWQWRQAGCPPDVRRRPPLPEEVPPRGGAEPGGAAGGPVRRA